MGTAYFMYNQFGKMWCKLNVAGSVCVVSCALRCTIQGYLYVTSHGGVPGLSLGQTNPFGDHPFCSLLHLACAWGSFSFQPMMFVVGGARSRRQASPC